MEPAAIIEILMFHERPIVDEAAPKVNARLIPFCWDAEPEPAELTLGTFRYTEIIRDETELTFFNMGVFY